MEINMKVILKIIIKKDLVLIIIKMDLIIKVNGKLINMRAMEYIIILTEKYIMVYGKII